LEKSAKTLFLYSHKYRGQKMVEKDSAKQCFQKHINSAGKKCWEKIIVKRCEVVRAKYVGEKNAAKIMKKRLLYSHEYRDQKWGRKKRAKQFFQKHTNSA